MEVYVTKIRDDDPEDKTVVVSLPGGDAKEFHYSDEVWKGVEVGDEVNQFQLQRAEQWEDTYQLGLKCEYKKFLAKYA